MLIEYIQGDSNVLLFGIVKSVKHFIMPLEPEMFFLTSFRLAQHRHIQSGRYHEHTFYYIFSQPFKLYAFMHVLALRHLICLNFSELRFLS